MPDYDIVLDGASYMLLPGSYRSYPDGNLYVDSRLGRQVLTDFTAGMAGPKLNARNMPTSALYGEASVGSWPAPWPLSMSAVGPAPRRVASGYNSFPGAEPKLVARADDYTYIAAGSELWRWDNVNAPELRFTFSDLIIDMARIRDTLYLSFDTAKSMSSYVDSTQTETIDHFGSTAHGARMATLGGGLVYQLADLPYQCRWQFSAGTGITRTLDGPVLAFVVYEDMVLAATALSIWSWTPAPSGATTVDFEHWGVVSSDGLQNADDYAWFKVFQGRLMAWRGGRAMLYDKQRGWWRHAGLEGALSHGAAVVNGWLIVSIEQRETNTPQLWGYNGSGWWLLDEAGPGLFPAGARGDRLVVWESGGTELFYYDMDTARDSSTISETFVMDTALLDGGEPDRNKFWRQIGVELARADPEDVGSWDYELHYSSDAGATWTSAGTAQTVSAATATVAAVIAVSSRYLRIRIAGTQTSGLPPFVMAAWAEFETLNDSVRRRRWQFKIAATDRVVNRGGALDPRDGAGIRSELWAVFSDAETVAFSDVDESAHQVRIIGLREEWHRPADVVKIGAHTTFDVTIVEL